MTIIGTTGSKTQMT